jgi:hypothetical protein
MAWVPDSVDVWANPDGDRRQITWPGIVAHRPDVGKDDIAPLTTRARAI